ncbi:MAG TPA: hypothetical protein VLZ83_09695 [Edaphocola sp.]|nr:hypothetical protein [Edaphocola sp.]
MYKKYYVILGILGFIMFVIRCKPDNPRIPNNPSPPRDSTAISVELNRVPYPKLSDYHFFIGKLKDQVPAEGVLPYKPASSLFTDYAIKNRFVWMPKDKKAHYVGDAESLDFPIGSVLIKNFYYNNVQPANNTRIIETRLMIMKEEGWVFAEYVWNEDQTEAFLDMNGSNTKVTWEKEQGVSLTANYRIPSKTECFTCHKLNEVPVAIGPQPQNLNNDLSFSDGTFNQLLKWVAVGYLEENSLPTTIQSTIDYTDVSQPLEMRVRSYLSISCGHCHQEGSHCSYRPLRLAFSETGNLRNVGVCVTPDEQINQDLKYIIMPKRTDASVMYYRLNTTDASVKMPLLGRSIVHEEGVELMKEWINSLNPCQ